MAKRLIWKFPIGLQQSCSILVSKDAEILSVEVQDKQLCLWVLTDPDAVEKVERKIVVFGTGQPFEYHPEVLSFIGTVHHNNFVWHFFEKLS